MNKHLHCLQVCIQ